MEELTIDYSMVIQHLKQIGKVKKLDKWYPHCTDPKSKTSSFWSVIFSYSMQQQWAISQSDCDVWWKVDFIWQLVMTSSVVGPRRSSKALPKAKVAPKKKVMVTVWRSAASLIHYSFLNLWEAITPEKYAQQIDERHGKLQRLQLALVNRRGPILHNNILSHASKVEPIGLWSFASSAIFTWPLANWLPLLQTSWQLFTGKMLPVRQILKHGFLPCRNKPTYFS